MVDGHNLLWSGTFGFPTKIKSQDKKRDLTGTFAFFAMLRTAIRDNLPNGAAEVLVVFDGKHGSSKRKELDPDYKANRSEDSDALRPLLFLPDIKRGLDLLNICWIELDEEEADDVIATITEKAPRDRNILIYS